MGLSARAAAPESTPSAARPKPGAERHLNLEGAANFRDLGGYVTSDGKRVRWGRLFRSDALDALTSADLKVLGTLNITQIADFRSNREVDAWPDRLPASLMTRRVHTPLLDVGVRPTPDRAAQSKAANAAFFEAINVGDVATVDRLLAEHYYPLLPRDGRASFQRWMRSLLEGPEDGVQVFHCTGGADRTGVAAALVLLTLGVPREQVVEDYLLTNHFLLSPQGVALTRNKGQAVMPTHYRLRAKYLEAAFTAMEADYGSVDEYLRVGLGIDDTFRAKLRARYLE